MAKNKHHSKTHRFDPSHLGHIQTAESSSPSVRSDDRTNYDVNTATFVHSDVRRLLWLVAIFILAEVVLWAAFAYTSLGAAVYRLV